MTRKCPERSWCPVIWKLVGCELQGKVRSYNSLCRGCCGREGTCKGIKLASPCSVPPVSFIDGFSPKSLHCLTSGDNFPY